MFLYEQFNGAFFVFYSSFGTEMVLFTRVSSFLTNSFCLLGYRWLYTLRVVFTLSLSLSATSNGLQHHTLAVLRCEIKNYRYFANEKRKCLDEYAQSLKQFNDRIEFYDQELKKIRSAGTGDGLGGFSPLSDVKFNDLVREKKTTEKKKSEWLSNNNHQFYPDICWWQSRIDTVEHYIDQLSAEQ